MREFNFHVKPVGLFDMLNFKNLVPNRVKKLSEGSIEPVTAVFNANKLAKLLHPAAQHLMIKDVIAHNENAKTFILKGSGLAPFRAGQYLSVQLKIGKSVLTRPYSISSSPAWVKDGKYALTVKRASGGFASDWILSNWEKETEVNVSGPEGNFYYEPLRDAKNILGIAGGSGITPFLSMAYALRDGLEDYNLTLLYGSCTEKDILFKSELEEIEKSCSKVKVVHVLSGEQQSCYEQGFITAELIEKYAVKPFSVFLCGPTAMYRFVDKELDKLLLKRKDIRHELFAAPASPKGLKGYNGDADQEYTLTVKRFGKTATVPMKASETVLVALERAGIDAPSHCRSGECGWCRSRMCAGKVFIPEDMDARRMADKEKGYIHPCCSYPLSDLTIEIWPQ